MNPLRPTMAWGPPRQFVTYSIAFEALLIRRRGKTKGLTRMMTSRKLVEYVAAEPFRPFRIRMASGQSFEIKHPEMILVGRAMVRVYTATEDVDNERWHDLSMLLMEAIEPLDPVAT